MTDSHGSPEADSEGPDVDLEIDLPEVPVEDSDGSGEADNDDVELNGEDPWKGLEEKSKKTAEVAEKTGVLKVTEDVIKAQLVSSAMKIEGDMNTPGTEANKLRTVWNELTPEGQSEFLKGNSMIWKVLEVAIASPMAPITVMETAWKFFKRKAFSAENLKVSDFKPEKVQMYCSLGVLECSDEDAKNIDQMAAKSLKVIANTAKVAKWVAMVIPGAQEFSPVLDKAGKGAGLLEKPAEWAGNLMPEVRREVKRQSVEVEKARMEQHNQAAEDVPEAQIPANGPMDDVKPANNESAYPMLNTPPYKKAA